MKLSLRHRLLGLSAMSLAALSGLPTIAQSAVNSPLALNGVVVSAEAQIPEAIDTPIDYSTFDGLMDKISVKQNGRPRIAYEHVREHAMELLEAYLAHLAVQNVADLAKDDALAYWLNVQNILVVKAITDEGKKKKDLKKLRGTGDKPGKLWTVPRITISGQKMSIYDVEQKILTEFDNPNVIYGLYQGVRGAPCLNDTAYRGSNVQALLERNAKRYINSIGIVRVNNDIVEVTPVFLWHKDILFGQDDKVLIDHLKANAEPTLKSHLYRGRTFASAGLNYRVDNYAAKTTKSRGTEVRQKAPQRQRPRQQSPQVPRGGGYGS